MATDPILQTREWARTSRDYRGEHPLCELCSLDGLTVPADCVDHIVPRRSGGAVWDSRNHQALCNPHHARKTRWERGVGRSVTVTFAGDVLVEQWEPPQGMRAGITAREAGE